jgi:hypothetical protein
MRTIIYLLFLIIFCFSCKQDDDVQAPQIPDDVVIDDDTNDNEDTIEIGDLVSGGVVFYVAPIPTDLDDDGVVDSGLICALSDCDTSFEWGCVEIDQQDLPNVISNPPSGLGAEIGDGMTNTNELLNDCIDAPAASAARSLGEKWFLPSAKELNEMYKHKHVLEAVSGVDLFIYYYWSSTESNSLRAWTEGFDEGDQHDAYKVNLFNVRAVRAF